MRLADRCSTVEYVLRATSSGCTTATSRSTARTTRTSTGLPPGPIASPGLASLQAAAEPADTDYIYYVLTGKDGSHTFATNNAEFLRGQAQVQGGVRRSDERSGRGLAIAIEQRAQGVREVRAGGRERPCRRRVARRRRRVRSTGCSARTARARPRRSRCCSASCARAAGVFEILGEDALAARARAAALGFLPEQPYFPTQLTAAEALRLYGRLVGLDSAADVAETEPALLERVGLEGRETTLLSKFSRGMLQRLGVAQALLGDPPRSSSSTSRPPGSTRWVSATCAT